MLPPLFKLFSSLMRIRYADASNGVRDIDKEVLYIELFGQVLADRLHAIKR